MKSQTLLALVIILVSQLSHAREDLITSAHDKSGEAIPYILNHLEKTPDTILILFPGGTGIMNPHIEEGKLVYQFKGNFLIRSRSLMVDDEFATVATNSSSSPERIQAILDDLKSRYPKAQIYLLGTSRSTVDTIALAEYLSDKIAGEIHTSSMNIVDAFDPRKYANRQLLVHHHDDACKATPYYYAQKSHDKFGTDLIVMEGGRSVGPYCEAFANHGYNGIEAETVAAIKKWIKQVPEKPAASTP